MYDPANYEYLGVCEECNCPLYLIDGRVVSSSDVPDHICVLKQEQEDE